MDDAQQLRYSRHLLLDDWPEAAQERLLAAHAVVIGAGGLGAPALLSLASPVVGLMGVMQAGEALKLLAGQGAPGVTDTLAGHTSLAGQLLMLDGRDWSWTRLRAKRDPACPVCGPR